MTPTEDKMKYVIIGLASIVAGNTHECIECGTRFHDQEIDSGWLEPDGSLICLECRYHLLLHKYQRLQRTFRILQRAFAEIKFALLNEGGSRWEVILGICEAYRGKFDARFN